MTRASRDSRLHPMTRLGRLPVDDYLRVLIDGFSGRDAGIILGSAVNTFCPDQLSTVQGWMANHGG